mmetsp:Transcript_51585/g.122741  ORF Transcript_51585/g.122741 Transcript_51585/m.122741 type:complete len:249 (+) Transcript_51585:54-800(+)
MEQVPQKAVMAAGQTKAPRRPVRRVILAGTIIATFFRFACLNAFVGGSRLPLQPTQEVDSKVAMGTRARRWNMGYPNPALTANRGGGGLPEIPLKDQYYIVYVRSKKIKQWLPFNLVNTADIVKGLKEFAANNEFVKALGGERFAEGQATRALGMQVYKEKDDLLKRVREMHAGKIRAAGDEVEWGYKEISDNAKFNEDPTDFFLLQNITTIPPEKELRNVLDDVGDAAAGAGSALSDVSDKVKGMFR